MKRIHCINMRFNVKYGSNVSDSAKEVYQKAFSIYAQLIRDNITVNVYVDDADSSYLPENVVGGAIPNWYGGTDFEKVFDEQGQIIGYEYPEISEATVSYQEFYQALAADAVGEHETNIDNQVFANLNPNSESIITAGGYNLEIQGMRLTTANAKAIGLIEEQTVIDGVILLNDFANNPSITWNDDYKKREGLAFSQDPGNVIITNNSSDTLGNGWKFVVRSQSRVSGQLDSRLTLDSEISFPDGDWKYEFTVNSVLRPNESIALSIPTVSNTDGVFYNPVINGEAIGTDSGEFEGLDRLSVAIHEIGHILGFVASPDIYDLLVAGFYAYDTMPPQYHTQTTEERFTELFGDINYLEEFAQHEVKNISPLDLFRYDIDENGQYNRTFRPLREEDEYGSVEPVFSLDGQTTLASFAAGQQYLDNLFSYDPFQASHWSQSDESTSGVMVPGIGLGQYNYLTVLDRQALDAIGYDVGGFGYAYIDDPIKNNLVTAIDGWDKTLEELADTLFEGRRGRNSRTSNYYRQELDLDAEGFQDQFFKQAFAQYMVSEQQEGGNLSEDNEDSLPSAQQGGSPTAGSDSIVGSLEDDTINGNASDDTISGNAGSDSLIGAAGNDSLRGNSGDDTLRGNNGDDVLEGDEGRDNLYGDVGNDFLRGGSRGDFLNGAAGNDTLNGGSGDDSLIGGYDADTLYGEQGYDTLRGGLGNDSLVGGDSFDLLYGEVGDDTLKGSTGNDSLVGGDGFDLLYGEAGYDTLKGGFGNDTLRGGAGNDSLTGGDGFDLLYGEAGYDTLTGGAGSDTLVGGDGIDSLFGGGGADIFYIQSNFGKDQIMDLELGVDRLRLTGGLTYDTLGFYSVSSGTLIRNSDGNDVALLKDIALADVSAEMFV